MATITGFQTLLIYYEIEVPDSQLESYLKNLPDSEINIQQRCLVAEPTKNSMTELSIEYNGIEFDWIQADNGVTYQWDGETLERK